MNTEKEQLQQACKKSYYSMGILLWEERNDAHSILLTQNQQRKVIDTNAITLQKINK